MARDSCEDLDVPPAPPLPPQWASAQPQQDSRCPYLEKLASAPENYLTDIPDTPYEHPVYEPVYYFFYGTLQDPATLSRILGLNNPPKLRSAEIVGYSLASWGQYRTLVDGPSGNVVEGSAYLVQSPEEEYKLAYYETSAYRLAPCRIKFTDGSEPSKISGTTFMYAGDAQALQEGRFDRRLWELQMGFRLPPQWDKKLYKSSAR